MTTNTDKLAAQEGCARHHLINCSECREAARVRELEKENERLSEALEAAGRVQQAEPVAFVDERAISWIAAQTRAKTAHITTKLSKEKSFERPLALFLAAPAERAPAPTVAEPAAVVRSVVGAGLDGVRLTWLRGFPQIGMRLYLAAPTAQEASKPVQAEAVSAEDEAYENAHPTVKRMRQAFEAKYGNKAALMRAANHWFNIRTQYNEAWNRDREQPITEADVDNAERALLATQPPAIPAAKPGKLKVTLQDSEGDRYRRMFEAACVALGQVSEALGLDPEDGGADPILSAIEDLKAAVHDAESAATQPPAIPAAPAVQASGEREAFEAKWPTPPGCQWTGNGYASIRHHDWAADDHAKRWEGWKARAALASPPASGEKP